MIAEAYIFAVPLISTSCFCGCAGRTQKCNIHDYSYRKCYVGSLCYRTYHSSHLSFGCGTSERSELCCEIRIDSYQNKNFTALKVGQPETLAMFRYRVHEPSKEGWRFIFEELVPVSMNRGYSTWNHHKRHKLSLEVTANRAFREMQPGMYYVENGNSSLYGSVLLNDIGESSLDKLGWFRFINGQWDIRRGAIKLRQAHNVYFTNCPDQIYYSSIDASYVVFNNSNGQVRHFDMGRLMSSDPWIDIAAYENRSIVVQHAEGLHVTMHIVTETRPKISRHSSAYTDFVGSIHLDEHSNHYMIVTFLEARGTMLGSVWNNETKSKLQDRVYVPLANTNPANFTTRISLSASINGTQYVCFHPKGDPDGEICHWLRRVAA
ncbi:hypothetical protein GCK32_007610 [Trichostrongylus colubriformis]|uniref:Uncharacterized protein n=1 Tax=Trichostrongylus colubriformis TaxID=6319 RepID=A0AAN8IR72_TRICO